MKTVMLLSLLLVAALLLTTSPAFATCGHSYLTSRATPHLAQFTGGAPSVVVIYEGDPGCPLLWTVDDRTAPSDVPESRVFQWGVTGLDVPVVRDFNGDGITDVVIYRRSADAWFVFVWPDGPAFVCVTGLCASQFPIPTE